MTKIQNSKRYDLEQDFLTVPVFAYFARLGDLNLGH